MNEELLKLLEELQSAVGEQALLVEQKIQEYEFNKLKEESE